MDNLKRIKSNFNKILLKATSIVVIGAFLFNIVFVELGWANSFLRVRAVRQINHEIEGKIISLRKRPPKGSPAHFYWVYYQKLGGKDMTLKELRDEVGISETVADRDTNGLALAGLIIKDGKGDSATIRGTLWNEEIYRALIALGDKPRVDQLQEATRRIIARLKEKQNTNLPRNNNSTSDKGALKYTVMLNGAESYQADIIGKKGVGSSELKRRDLPIPEAFVINTEFFENYRVRKDITRDLWEEILAQLENLHRITGKRFGDNKNPLILSVRSSPCVSLPGVLDTVMNIGINDEIVQVLAQKGGEYFAYDSYRRLIEEYSVIVLGMDRSIFENMLLAKLREKNINDENQLEVADLKSLVDKYKDVVVQSGKVFPQDIYEQLRLAIKAVFDSWNKVEAREFRKAKDIPDDLSMAVIIQEVVFGNLNENSVSGVLFTRNPNTGKNELFGKYLIRAQGRDIVYGRIERRPLDIESLNRIFPQVYTQLLEIKRQLEEYFKTPQEIEFTIQNGKLYILQNRDAILTPLAKIRIAKDFEEEGVIKPLQAAEMIAEARERGEKAKVNNEEVSDVYKEEVARALLFKGEIGSSGVMSGKLIFSVEKALELAEKGEKIVLFATRKERRILIAILHRNIVGLVTTYGNSSSHEAVQCRAACKPCLVGVSDVSIADSNLFIENKSVEEGTPVVVDGKKGRVLLLHKHVLTSDSSLFVNCYHTIKDRAEDLDRHHRNEMGVIKTPYNILIVQHSNAWRELEELEKNLMRLKAGDGEPIHTIADKKESLRSHIYRLNIQARLLHDLIIEKGQEIGKADNEIEADLKTYKEMSESEKGAYKKQTSPAVNEQSKMWDDIQKLIKPGDISSDADNKQISIVRDEGSSGMGTSVERRLREGYIAIEFVELVSSARRHFSETSQERAIKYAKDFAKFANDKLAGEKVIQYNGYSCWVDFHSVSTFTYGVQFSKEILFEVIALLKDFVLSKKTDKINQSSGSGGGGQAVEMARRYTASRDKLKGIAKSPALTDEMDREFPAKQNFILYAEEILNNGGVIDAEDILKVLYDNGKLGKIFIFAEDPGKARVLERLVKDIDSEIEIVMVTKETLPANLNEVEEIKNLIERAKEAIVGSEKNLSVMKGRISEGNRPALEALAEEQQITVFLFKSQAGEKHLYSLADGLKLIISGQKGIIFLTPLPLTQDIEEEIKEYNDSLELYSAS